jgi:hypothetical protein
MTTHAENPVQPPTEPATRLEDHPLWRLMLAAEGAYPYVGVRLPESHATLADQPPSDNALRELAEAARGWSEAVNQNVARVGGPTHARESLIASVRGHQMRYRESLALVIMGGRACPGLLSSVAASLELDAAAVARVETALRSPVAAALGVAA